MLRIVTLNRLSGRATDGRRFLRSARMHCYDLVRAVRKSVTRRSRSVD